MTGYEACQILKNQESTKDIPIIFLSAKGQDAEIRLGLELGAEEYIVKPFTPDELAECVNKVLVKCGRV